MILRGWQPRDWVRTLGAQCKVDPEFFRRHLDFLEPASYFDLPALPSTSQNLWRLRVTTICNRVNPLSAEEVRKQRKDDLEGVNKFLNALRASERIGSSIVRRHAIINETTCVIEQDISFCVQKRRSGGWTGFIWLDNGKPFDDNSIAPWLENYKAKFSSHNPYLPIVQHLDKMALNPPNSEVFDMSQIPRSTSAQSRNTFHASQTLSNLPEQYGMSLNRKLMKMDALYAFSDLFNVALCSENQFLNMIQAEINVAIRSFHGQEENCIDILSYCKGLIDEHYDRLREMVALLENEENNGWPRVTEGPEFWTRDDIAKALRKDVQHLLYRCSTLAERAIDGTNFIRNYAMLLTSERSISQAKEVGRLTLLAYFFLPMSLVTSLFGMNFVEIEDWRKAVISAVAVFAGVMTISLIICI
ncbi:uncharacterized protein BDZ99DRAFT_414865 [Mytilinidion resinicola]|uniref:Cora-domain-containing protein n=1 Tax=Mytilinidion resinicola TaxID=574789 RepID=A0A6A6YRP3_9PEZI|nr:uncharacterized protein BDZ99DRAFT_414865 [Mytilinidion resinicola]KAF2810714.1 hypothetical protein BDZ99DRAFT_414865 [Mytilinidion resinicola]